MHNAESRPATGRPRRARPLSALIWLIVLSLGAFGVWAQDAAPPDRTAVILRLDGAVSPATADYIIRGLDTAADREAALVILEMDTPGGLSTSMRDIIRAILASPVPVASYVSPSGARAASAGTYILYASHIAAMAPATNLGAATPVAVGGGGGLPGLPGTGGEDSGDEAQDTPSRSASEAKAINDAVAYIRGLAELRGRNADWAEAAVREARSLTATAARDDSVIDFVAADRGELLRMADGRRVTLNSGEVTLRTAGLSTSEIAPDWRSRFLGVITDPNVALILMMVGIYGLIFEFLNPGVLVPGTLGGISLLTGLYALALLPLNFAGAGLILLGVALMVAEAFAPSFGVLGIGGVAAIVLGATMLIDSDVPAFDISVPLIAAVAVAALGLTLIIARLAMRSLRARVVSGREELVGAEGEVLDWTGTTGHVWLHGERWQAKGDAPLAQGQRVRVRAVSGLKLIVEPPGGD
ncbi:nodulation protein NfeD [Rhodobacteraceae bacterium WD3A24]|nr:nodulation protein NfeD [Rhodobacteraceae bacterium WD3A24]